MDGGAFAPTLPVPIQTGRIIPPPEPVTDLPDATFNPWTSPVPPFRQPTPVYPSPTVDVIPPAYAITPLAAPGTIITQNGVPVGVTETEFQSTSDAIPSGLIPPSLSGSGGVMTPDPDKAMAGVQIGTAIAGSSQTASVLDGSAPSGTLTGNTSATLPAGTSVTQATPSTVAPTVGTPTSALGNFLTTVEDDVADVVSNPTRHLVLIGVVLLVGWWWFFKRKRR